MRKLTHEEIVARQTKQAGKNTYPVVVVLNDIRSLYNVGSIFRTADGAGVGKLWLCGITGTPPNNQISKTALGAEDSVAWEHRWEILPLLRELKEKGYEIALLEQTTLSIPYESYQPKGPVCFVIGNEIEGISDEILSLCDQAIEIGMEGIKNSLNVSVAFGVIAYHLREYFQTNSRQC